MDLLTKEAKDYGGYFDAANLEDAPLNVDVLAFKVGEPPKPGLPRGILGACRVVYGDGRRLLEYAKTLGDPTLGEAAGVEYMELSERASDPLLKDRHARGAFDSLFRAARIASMAYLSINVGRWGLVRRELPDKTKFNGFITALHVKYFSITASIPRKGPRKSSTYGLRRWKATLTSLKPK